MRLIGAMPTLLLKSIDSPTVSCYYSTSSHLRPDNGSVVLGTRFRDATTCRRLSLRLYILPVSFEARTQTFSGKSAPRAVSQAALVGSLFCLPRQTAAQVHTILDRVVALAKIIMRSGAKRLANVALCFTAASCASRP